MVESVDMDLSHKKKIDKERKKERKKKERKKEKKKERKTCNGIFE